MLCWKKKKRLSILLWIFGCCKSAYIQKIYICDMYNDIWQHHSWLMDLYIISMGEGSGVNNNNNSDNISVLILH